MEKVKSSTSFFVRLFLTLMWFANTLIIIAGGAGKLGGIFEIIAYVWLTTFVVTFGIGLLIYVAILWAIWNL